MYKIQQQRKGKKSINIYTWLFSMQHFAFLDCTHTMLVEHMQTDLQPLVALKSTLLKRQIDVLTVLFCFVLFFNTCK